MTLSLSRSLSPRTTIDNGSDQLLEKSPKKFRSTNRWLETKKIQNALEERKALMEEKRVEKLAQLSQGEWIPSSHLVKVTKQVGRHWATMGHSYLGELYLDPEEALFLLEANTIEIYFNGIPMSLQQAYSVLLGGDSGCTLEEYRAFAHLTRFGYKVRRHRPELVGKRKRDEPLEIDVVGVIRRRKSCDREGPRNVVKIEDAIEVVDSVEESKTSAVKNLPSPVQPLPPTSEVNNTAPSADDDDIKFLEIVDTSKRRKVLSSVVIHDDVEISVAFNGSNASSGQTSSNEQDNAQKKEGQSIVEPNISIHPVSDCELVEYSNDKSRPSRGMYTSNLFTPMTSSSNEPECISSINTPSTSRNHCRNQANSGATNEKVSAPKATETNDDVIVLSDDEEEEDKQARELLKYYKEISLIELIDISEDEEGKAVSNATGVGNSRVDENYDFWGVLGRIPTLEKGRMVIKIPAPPSQLIPLNVQPSQDEYVVNATTSTQRISEAERQRIERTRIQAGGSQGSTSGEWRGAGAARAAQERTESRSNSSQGRDQSDRQRVNSQGSNRVMERNSYLLHTPMHQATHPQDNYPHQWQRSYTKNAWNPWAGWNHHAPTMNYYSNTSMPMNCWENQYQTTSNRPLWSSLVYSERQVDSYHLPNANQQHWTSSSVSHFHHSAQQVNYQNYGQNASGHNWDRNRMSHWQSNSGYSYGPRSGGRWQRQSGLWPRRGGSRHYGRGGRHLLPLPRRDTPQDTRAQDTFSASVVPKVPHARNWLELKIKSKKTKPTESLIEPKVEADKEDSKDILPLLKPADSINIDAVQSKLQVTSSGKDSYYAGPENYQSSLSIKFDLYMPNSNFRKSSPGLPKYRLSIVKSDDKIPKVKDTWYLTKDLNDEVPLLFAVGFTECVNFFSFSNVKLPAPLTQ